MGAKIEARVTHDFKVPAERVYDAWLSPEHVRVWLAAALRTFGLPGDIRQVEIDARVGGKFLFTDMRGDVEQRHWGTYLELDRPRKIVHTWIVDVSGEADPSRVTLTLEPTAEGCVARIVHEMDAQWADLSRGPKMAGDGCSTRSTSCWREHGYRGECGESAIVHEPRKTVSLAAPRPITAHAEPAPVIGIRLVEPSPPGLVGREVMGHEPSSR